METVEAVEEVRESRKVRSLICSLRIQILHVHSVAMFPDLRLRSVKIYGTNTNIADAAPLLAGSGLGIMRPSTPRVRGKSGNRRLGEKCEHCNKAEDKESIVVCESCDLGFHKYCLDPPMALLPDYDWHCPKCLVGTGEYGFEEGGIYSLKVFQEKANNFKQHYFSSRMPFDPILNTHKQPTEDEIEREFWRLVESLTETVEVEYGADIHSTTHGSGFPTIEKNPLNQYSKHPWNLNVLPFHEESLFRHIKTDISGMTVPWLYVGMCFSTFCWHNEDHYTYSANYQHFGATKTWYGIPGKDAHAFEEAMRKAVPELFETQPDLLFQLVTLLPPEQLRKAGVEVYALDQRAGQFVITFPQAYHAGFNHGFNFNEAVNFAPADWEPFGEAGVERLQEFRRQPCFPHDELLLTAASVDSSIKTAKWLAPALERMHERELRLRAELEKRHHDISPHQHCKVWASAAEDVEPQCGLNFVVKDEVLQEEDYQCYHCKAYSFLTQFRCDLSSRVSCLLHTETVDCCTEGPVQRLLGPNHTLRYRYSNEDLGNLVQKVVDKAAVPEAWESKLETLLQDESRPPLKSMHTLLAEGDKIPYPLRGLDSLSDFVKRCDQWVDEANLYLTRKQQNRRKNEKAWRRQSTKGTKIEEKDSEPHLTLDRMNALIEEGENLGFQCVQLEHLNEKLASVNDWRSEAKSFLRNQVVPSEQIEAHLEIGRSFLATMPELTDLETLYHVRKWTEDAVAAQENIKSQSLGQCKAILDRAKELAIPPSQLGVVFFNEMVRQGDFWEQKAKEIMAAEIMHYPQLDALHSQVEKLQFPVNPETLAQMDAILTKNREAHKQIVTLYEKSQDPDFRKRPLYTDIREVMKTLEDLNSKPQGTIDLERELRRHEDWMRKGKKLFGKANAPLHILEVHMKFVEEKNNFCFDLNDTFRPPVEPASRETSPNEDLEKGGILGEDEKPVFCICRQPENGMMIMCENCREW
jgi:[histone H3]-trimethyl-L-lysine4 demethylase